MTDHPVVPVEADWDRAPTLLDGAGQLTMTARQCDLGYWLTAVAQGTLRGRAEHGHASATPDHLREPGPLRDALMLELGCRSIAEEKAVRILAHYVAAAPGVPELEFYATQLIDEARHSMVFRSHLVDLGMPESGLVDRIRELAGDYVARVLDPIEEFATAVVRDDGDFIAGAAVFTIIIEGVLAPAAELSERKWQVLDPAAGEIARGASIDEIRHLAVGSSIVREHLVRHPDARPRLMAVLRRGRRLWDEVPDEEFVLRREELFQEGMQEHRGLLRDYELFPGRRLLDTTARERYDLAARWTDHLGDVRLSDMGLPEAIDLMRVS